MLSSTGKCTYATLGMVCVPHPRTQLHEYTSPRAPPRYNSSKLAPGAILSRWPPSRGPPLIRELTTEQTKAQMRRDAEGRSGDVWATEGGGDRVRDTHGGALGARVLAGCAGQCARHAALARTLLYACAGGHQSQACAPHHRRCCRRRRPGAFSSACAAVLGARGPTASTRPSENDAFVTQDTAIQGLLRKSTATDAGWSPALPTCAAASQRQCCALR
jgi:hypothetical protein